MPKEDLWLKRRFLLVVFAPICFRLPARKTASCLLLWVRKGQGLNIRQQQRNRADMQPAKSHREKRKPQKECAEQEPKNEKERERTNCPSFVRFASTSPPFVFALLCSRSRALHHHSHHCLPDVCRPTTCGLLQSRKLLTYLRANGNILSWELEIPRNRHRRRLLQERRRQHLLRPLLRLVRIWKY